MFSSIQSNRKRSRDEDDSSAAFEPADKRYRTLPFQASAAFTISHPRVVPWPTHAAGPRADSAIDTEDESLRSIVSDTGSTTDSSMDMDLDKTLSTIIPTSWSLSPTPPTAPTVWSSSVPDDPSVTLRKTSTSNTSSTRPVRPRPWPLQTSPPVSSFRTSIHQNLYASTDDMILVSASQSHTPSASLASSRFSQLSVNDMDLDPGPMSPTRSPRPTILTHHDRAHDCTATPTMAELKDSHLLSSSGPDALTSTLCGPTVARRQRQRSGAFISSPCNSTPMTCSTSSSSSAAVATMPARASGMVSRDGDTSVTTVGSSSRGGGGNVGPRFQVGYRDDCERCRLRVQGHMNHFSGS